MENLSLTKLPTGGVLFVTPWKIKDTSGGVNVVVLNLYSNFLDNKDLKPAICAVEWGQRRITKLENYPYDGIEFDMVYPARGFKSFLVFLLRFPVCLLRLYRYTQEDNIKVINFHYPSRTALCVAFLKWIGLFKGKMILSFHGTDVHKIDDVRLIDLFIYNNVDHMVTCSVVLSKILESKIPEKFHKKIQTIHNAISPKDFSHQNVTHPEMSKVLEGKKYILSVGRFDPNKGLSELIEVFNELSRTDPSLYLVLVGASTPYLQDLRIYADRLGIEKKVIFFENIPNQNMGLFYQNASIFVLNSKKEGFPLVILEAGLYKIPVVAKVAGGIPEIIQDGKNGVLIPQESNSKTLEDNLTYLLGNEAQSRKYGKELYDSILREFTWEKKYQEYLNVFRSETRSIADTGIYK